MYVYVMSFVLLVLAIVLGVYGYLSIGGRTFKPTVGKYSATWTINPNTALGFICIAGAILALVLSILGFFVQGCKNCCFATPYALINFVAAILAFAFGAAVVGGDYTTKIKKELCENPTFGGP